MYVFGFSPVVLSGLVFSSDILQELFSKLRFQYLEQVTKEKFLNAILDDKLVLADHDQNVALEARLAQEKARLKAHKLDVEALVARLDSKSRDLAESMIWMRHGDKHVPFAMTTLSDRVQDTRMSNYNWLKSVVCPSSSRRSRGPSWTCESLRRATTRTHHGDFPFLQRWLSSRSGRRRTKPSTMSWQACVRPWHGRFKSCRGSKPNSRRWKRSGRLAFERRMTPSGERPISAPVQTTWKTEDAGGDQRAKVWRRCCSPLARPNLD